MLLEEYIRCVINEAAGYNQLNTLISDLNSVVEEYRSENRNYAVHDELIYFAESFGLEEVGSGSYRKVYALPQENWVLKIAYGYDDSDYNFALSANRDELRIAEGEHGIGSRDIFVKVLGSDKLSELPTWIITERAVVLKSAKSFFSLEDVRKIFPTFWNALKEYSPYKSNVSSFCSFTSDVIDALSQSITPGNSVSNLSRKDFYNAIKEANFHGEESIVDFDKLIFSEDAIKIIRACAYSIPIDMHNENIGIINSGSPSPEDIVIIDYMIEQT